MRPGYYSPNFSRREMIASETAARRGISNEPAPKVEANLRRVCVEVLEPLRARFGPYLVTSGYRCHELNALIGGSPSSAHMEGLAEDGRPLDGDVTLVEVVAWLVESKIPFDQVIYEYGEWVHVALARDGEEPRRQVLMKFHGTGCLPWDPLDARVK